MYDTSQHRYIMPGMGGNYGSAETTARYLDQNDVPDYAVSFYSTTEQEIFSSIKYGTFTAEYGSNAVEVREALLDTPTPIYVAGGTAPDGHGRQDNSKQVHSVAFDHVVNKIRTDAAREILDAQRAMRTTRVTQIEYEKTEIIRKVKKRIVVAERHESK